MPLYEYQCEACGQRFEVIRKFSDPPLEVCAVCGKGPIARLQSSPAIQFKGSGWYITDYAQKGRSEKSPKDSTEGGTSDTAARSDAGAKPDTTAKSDAPAKSESGSKSEGSKAPTPAASSSTTPGT